MKQPLPKISMNLQLPWSSSDEDDRRLTSFFWILMIPFVVFSVVIPMVELPEKDRKELEKLPPQLAKLQLENKPTPPPVEPEPEKPKEKPKQEKKEPKDPEKKDIPKPKPEPAKLIEAKQAAQAEISQFADALDDMHEAFDLDEVDVEEVSIKQGEAKKVERDLITSQAKTKAGPLDTASLSRDTGDVALEGKTSTKVSSKIKGSTTQQVAGTNKGKGGSGKAPYRSAEEIRKVIDANKSKIYAIYNRALRKDPTLEGVVRFKIVIEPDGSVSKVTILSSDLESPDLENKLINRVKLIKFGAKSVSQTTLEYDLEFLPF